MTVWAEGDALSPSNLNNNSASATSLTGFSTNTLGAETGSSISALGNVFSASTLSATEIVVGAGSAVAPAVRINSEASLGFYRSAASELAVSYGTFVPSDLSATGHAAFSTVSSSESILANEVWASGVSVGSAITGGTTLQIGGNTLLGTTTPATGDPRLDIG